MKLRISAIWLVVLVTLQGSVAAQEWSSWTTAHSNWTTLFNNKDVQYRWLTSTSSGSQECQLQLRDLKRQPTQATVVSVHIDYQYHDAESMRDVVTIMDVKGENQGEATVYNCVSVGDVRVTDLVRFYTMSTSTTGH